MNCWHCDKPANGVCRFCGRALCKKDAQTMPYIVTAYIDHHGLPDVLVTNNTLFCGICQPAPRPIEIPEMDPKLSVRRTGGLSVGRRFIAPIRFTPVTLRLIGIIPISYGAAIH